MARTRATITVDGPSQKPIVQTAPPLRRSMRSTRASQPIHDDASDEDESEAVPEKTANRKKKLPNQSQEVTPEESPPAARYHTRSKQVKLSEFSDHLASEDHEDIMELPTWPRYKDDLPNAFNGEVDPSLDFISKAPVEIIDSILSFLILDHDPERGVKMKEGNYKPRPHVLISMSAMSRLFYHATEGFARKFLVKNKEALSAPYISSYYRSHPEQYQAYLEHQDTWKKAREEKISKLRRSPRISSQPQPVSAETSRGELWRTFQSRCALCLEHADTRGKFANTVKVCSTCDQAINGMSSTLTEALNDYDLRDYMLMKTRKPGPRAKFTDLPAITYSSEYKSLGFPVFKTMTVFHFRDKDLERLANLVHGDWISHMRKKRVARAARQQKAQVKRVRKFIIDYHERELEVSKGKVAIRHEKRLAKLRALAPDEIEEGVTSRFGCSSQYCYHDVGLCDFCGDVLGRNHDNCHYCDSVWSDRRLEQFYSRLRPAPVQSGSSV